MPFGVTLSRNTTIIFYNEAEKHIAIGVAGTNFISKFDWFVEDLEVENLVPWNDSIVKRGGNIGKVIGGYIATGMAKALFHTWNTKDHLFGKSLVEWLK